MQINRLIRFDPNFFPSSQRGRLSISVWWGYSEQCCQGSGCGSSGCLWAILKIQSREKLQSRGLRFFGLLLWSTAAAQSVYRQIQIKIDPFTNIYHSWNLHLATSEWRGAYITNNVSFSQNIQHSRNKHDNSHYSLYKIINTRLR